MRENWNGTKACEHAMEKHKYSGFDGLGKMEGEVVVFKWENFRVTKGITISSDEI